MKWTKRNPKFGLFYFLGHPIFKIIYIFLLFSTNVGVYRFIWGGSWHLCFLSLLGYSLSSCWIKATPLKCLLTDGVLQLFISSHRLQWHLRGCSKTSETLLPLLSNKWTGRVKSVQQSSNGEGYSPGYVCACVYL